MIKVNHEHFKVTGDNTVTVTVEFDMNPKCSGKGYPDQCRRLPEVLC